MKEIIDILNCMTSNCGHKEHALMPWLFILAIFIGIIYIKLKSNRNKSK